MLTRGLRIILLAAPLSLQAAEPQVHEYQLENGLKILVQEDHRSPAIVSQVWYKVGASNEYGGITGISHMLEHMMFKGTQKHPPGEFSRIIAANGGGKTPLPGRTIRLISRCWRKPDCRSASSWKLIACAISS